MVEACNSIFQVHLQVEPAEFARMYNLAQLLAAPLMAVSANSPLLFGRRLWAETRIALFRQAVDTRTHTHHLRESEARVSFGTRWVERSVTEIFQEDIARFRTLVGTDLDEDPMAVLDAGGVPALKALRLHNGTIYRWNRVCYGVTEGKPHLRIENRIMPSGPSVLDEVANAALWFGLMVELCARGVDPTVESTSTRRARTSTRRRGLGARLTGSTARTSRRRRWSWSTCARSPSGPAPAAVTRRHRRYLGVVDERVRTGRTGARWQLASWNSLRDRGTPVERANALVAATVQRQLTPPGRG
jgi:hypothetical protein